MTRLLLRRNERTQSHHGVAPRRLVGLTLLLIGTALPVLAKEPGPKDFPCLLTGIRPEGRKFVVYHKNKRKMRKAAAIAARDLPGKAYPVGTVIQVLPIEAMMKREKGYNPAGHDWEWFQLTFDADGNTTIKSHGGAEVKNFASCQGCHLTGDAPAHDLVCEGHNSIPSFFTLDQAVVAQANDPRCKKRKAR